MHINYQLVQKEMETHSGELQKNDIAGLLNGIDDLLARGMITEFFLTELKVNVLDYLTEEIPAGTFSNVDCIDNVTLPETVTTIGKAAFKGSSVKSVIIPEGVNIIQHQTFANCSNLQMVTLPGTIKKVADNAFENCTSLEAILLPKALMSKIPQIFPGIKVVQPDPASPKKVPDSNDPLTKFYMSVIKPY